MRRLRRRSPARCRGAFGAFAACRSADADDPRWPSWVRTRIDL